MKLRPVLRGIVSYFPGVPGRRRGTGGTTGARYCYSTWLRHLILLFKNGMREHPTALAEIGPGDSLGTGIAALLSGAREYAAFDLIKHSNIGKNLEIFEELVELFEKREAVPDNKEFPKLRPNLDSYKFPFQQLSEEKLEKLLDKSRIEQIRDAILHCIDNSKKNAEIRIFYIAPWTDPKSVDDESLDMVFSQAVMEHVEDIELVYNNMYNWLKTGGYVSHVIDYRAHETHNTWNGHWSYSDLPWKIIMHGRSYPINRHPHSNHVAAIRKAGLKIICESRDKNFAGIKKKHLAPAFKSMKEEDLLTCSALIQAHKIQPKYKYQE
ncbi:MAG: methyltransferase domain-containing protein [Candidatus Aminicenantes bacterium]|jgi:SAM-dependent methyltransferase